MKVLVTGASGMLGSAVSKFANQRGHEVLTPSHRELDFEHEATTFGYLRLYGM